MIPDLPERMKLVAKDRSLILSKDGKVMESMATEFRKPIRIQDVPKRVIDATLAAEDKRYYDHQGVDFWGMGRAVFSTVSGKRVEGGSTITMQLVKRTYTNSRKTVDRKVQDMALATMIERQLTKSQILELYLNQVFYGAGAYGIAAAAEVYFGKTADKLTLSEAALLARCVRRPSDENPYVDMKTALHNRDVVLGIMHDEGWITETEYGRALKEKIVLKKRVTGSQDRIAPYFCDYVKSVVRKELPDIDLTSGGYRIETTIDLRLQAYAEKEVKRMVSRNRGLRITTSAFLLMDASGGVLAMVGGPDYKKNQFNVITQGRRQPGSAFKPLVYATAFEYGALDPDGSVSNEKYYIEDRGRKRPIRGGGQGGDVSVRRALAQSINNPAMWAMDKVGLDNVIAMSHSAFGIESDLPRVETIALGADEVTPMELATAYSVFQSGGDRFTPFGIVRIIGPDGLPVKVFGPNFKRRQLSPEAALGMDSCLRGVVAGGTGSRAGDVTNARGKTGTTSENKDAWFCGYTDKFIGVGWVANETKDAKGRVRYRPMDDYVMGGHMVAPLWADILNYAQEVYGEQPRSMRGGSSRRTADEPVVDDPREENGGAAEPTTEPEPEVQEPDTGMPGDEASGADGTEGTPEGAEPAQAGPSGTKRDKPAEKHGDTNPTPEGRGDGRLPVNDNVVLVEVCVDSGLRASRYCPERIRKAYRPGSAPKARCRTHKGPDG